MRLPLLSVLAFITLTGMSCLPRVDSTADSIGLVAVSIEATAKAARELCGTPSPEPCVGVLPTSVRDQMKTELQRALDATKEANAQLNAGSSGDNALAKAQHILEIVKGTLEVYQ